MKIEKKVTTTEVVEVEIQIPSFYRDKYDTTSIGVFKDCIINISKGLIWIYDRKENNAKHIEKMIAEALESKNECTKEQFMELYHDNLNKFINFKG